MKCDAGHSHFDLGSYVGVDHWESRYSHLTPTDPKALSLGKLPLLPLTPIRQRHSYSHSHAPIAKLGAGVGWDLGRKKAT